MEISTGLIRHCTCPEVNQNHHMEVLDEGVKVIKQVKALSSDLLRPKYHVTYTLVSSEPKTVRVWYVW